MILTAQDPTFPCLWRGVLVKDLSMLSVGRWIVSALRWHADEFGTDYFRVLVSSRNVSPSTCGQYLYRWGFPAKPGKQNACLICDSAAFQTMRSIQAQQSNRSTVAAAATYLQVRLHVFPDRTAVQTHDIFARFFLELSLAQASASAYIWRWQRHRDQTPVFTLTVRTPHCGNHSMDVRFECHLLLLEPEVAVELLAGPFT